MSLRHGVLGLLAELEHASGYDLMKIFDVSLAGVWPATQSQLYTELGKLTTEGLIEVAAEGARNRKEYRITAAGRAELRHWLVEVPARRPLRDETLLRVFFLGQLEPEEARDYLRRGATYLDQRLEKLAEDEKNNINWGDDNLSRYGRLVMEYGKRYLTLRRDWQAEAADRIAPAD
ncbi:PadR family transcriptional regulator [Nocardia sp. alder85J]|uniref:PadR family transcriptional regulator n=1 Tax=Nocardia sp. alder85J TaxID=2862949 RepID=UPI001CD79CCB|nr:PadR family transcriptional regulator [Nocardia sp. alder85J]MCX4093790.1 PadR family transcriptional regulator [Nocardia sp. alder85J]